MAFLVTREAFMRSTAALFAVPPALVAAASQPFNVLILGDSIAWGQGLTPEEKWRNLLCEKLQLALGRPVAQYAPAIHSGATIGIGDFNEIGLQNLYKGPGASYVDSGDDIGGEIPSSTPTVLEQLDRFANFPARPNIDLCVVVASINDVSNLRWLNPLLAPQEISRLIEIHCHQHLLALLDRVRTVCIQQNPACLCVVMSYYQVLSEQSLPLVIQEGPELLEALFGAKLDAKLKAHIQAIVASHNAALLMPFVERSRSFAKASDEAIYHAVKDANRPPFDKAASFIFASPAIAPEDALFTTKDPRLWGVVPSTDADGKPILAPQDDVAAARIVLCDALFPPAQNAAPFCHVASIAHPRPEAAKLNYLPAIWDAIAGRLNLLGLDHYPT